MIEVNTAWASSSSNTLLELPTLSPPSQFAYYCQWPSIELGLYLEHAAKYADEIDIQGLFDLPKTFVK